MHRLVLHGISLILLLLASVSSAQPRAMEAGLHFAEIQPALSTASPADIIEIRDVFWYGCPVCREFEPMISYYGREIRGDLTLARMPAVWNPLMAVHARLYYTAVKLGIADTVHPAAFHYLQDPAKAQTLNNAAEVGAFLASFGVEEEAFSQAWEAPEVLEAVAQAQRDTQAAGIDSLPVLLLNGRYRVKRNAAVPELSEIIIITNQLIKTLRDERRGN